MSVIDANADTPEVGPPLVPESVSEAVGRLRTRLPFTVWMFCAAVLPANANKHTLRNANDHLIMSCNWSRTQSVGNSS